MKAGIAHGAEGRAQVREAVEPRSAGLKTHDAAREKSSRLVAAEKASGTPEPQVRELVENQAKQSKLPRHRPWMTLSIATFGSSRAAEDSPDDQTPFRSAVRSRDAARASCAAGRRVMESVCAARRGRGRTLGFCRRRETTLGPTSCGAGSAAGCPTPRRSSAAIFRPGPGTCSDRLMAGVDRQGGTSRHARSFFWDSSGDARRASPDRIRGPGADGSRGPSVSPSFSFDDAVSRR